MLGIGILFSELAHEAESSMLDRLWPFFLLVVAAAAAATLYFALRKPDAKKNAPHDEADDV